MNTPLKRIAFALTLIIVVSMLAACAKPEAEVVEVEVTRVVAGTPETVIITATPEPREEPPPEEEAPDTLIVVTAETPPTLDPDYYAGISWVRFIGQVYEPVLDYEQVSEAGVGIPEGTDVASVAKINGQGDEGIVGNFFESWEISEDGQTYIMHVREGYKSYYGDQATADDWIWRVERAFATHDMGEFQVMISGITGPEDVKKIDDMTVEIRTPKGPSPIFFKALCVQVVTAIDVDRLREEGWITADDPWANEAMKHHNFGFGPWHVVEFTPGEQLVFEANPNYYKPLFFKKVILREVPESGNRLAMLVAGEAHITQELTLVQLEELRGGKGEARLVDLPMASEWHNCITNVTWGTFSNVQCFQALGYAMPYEEIQRTAFHGFGQIAHTVMAPMFGATINTQYHPYRHDIEKARELWEAGNCPDTWTLSFSSDVPHHEDVAVLIRTEFDKLGVDVVLDKLPTSVLYQKTAEGSIEAFVEESSAFVADAGYAAWLNWHCDSFGNQTQFCDDELSAKIDSTMSMRPSPERNKILWDIQEEIMDRGGRIFILWPGWHVGAHKHIQGVSWHSDNFFHWKDLYWE
jgi:peptide/nickel transport system substrate-binding protein